MVKLFVHSILTLALLNAASPALAQSRSLTQLTDLNPDANRELGQSPEAALTCDCWLSQEAKDAGVSVIADASCSEGGKGCVGTSCRFCRVSYSEESQALYACSDLPLTTPSATTPSPTTPAPTTPAPTMPAPTTPTPTTPAPTTPSPTTPKPTTPAPTTPTPTTPAPTKACSAWLTPGDKSASISIFSDPTCIPSGGLGCVGTACRFCKTADTPQSKLFLPCPSIPQVTTPVPTAPSTATGSPPSPATTIPPPPPPAPTTTSPAVVDECQKWSTPGDRAAGVLVYADGTCSMGGMGCVGKTCRFCKTKVTPQSQNFVDCSAATIAANSGSAPPAPSPAPTTTPAPTPTSTPTPTTTTSAPVTFAPASVDECTKWSTVGDRAVGILVSTDQTCLKGGVGCLGSTTCRYCKTKVTPQSQNFIDCTAATIAANGGSPSSSPSTPSATSPSPSPSVPIAPSNVDECAKWSTVGDRAVGVLVSSDPTCANGGVGCIGTTCRYCKALDTLQAKNFIPCSTGTGTGTTTGAGDATIILPSSVDVCTKYSTVGDRNVGISVVGDATCSKGGIGCIGGSCRYCRYKDTPQSNHLLTCTAVGGSGTASQSVSGVQLAAGTAGSAAAEAGSASSGLVAAVIAGVVAIAAVMAFAVQRANRKKTPAALTTPMCLDQRSASMSNL